MKSSSARCIESPPAIPVLRPFAVGNRPNCYVLSPMFYLRIQEDKSVKKTSKRQLLLEVFGLGEAGVDINTHLMNMVKNKLKVLHLGIYFATLLCI